MRAINQWREFMLERDISPTARLIGFCLAQYYRPEKLTYPSQATLMRDSGYSRNTVREAVRELEREGLVKIEEKVIRGNSFKSFSYTFIGSTGDPISNPMADPSINPSINPSTNRSINRLAVDPEIYKDNKEKKNIKKEKKKNPAQPNLFSEIKVEKPKKNKYGKYEKVQLTEEQHQLLKQRFGDYLEEKIEALDYYIYQTGKRYKDHYAVILNWDRRDKQRAGTKNKFEVDKTYKELNKGRANF